jgi:carbonic anhydrase
VTGPNEWIGAARKALTDGTGTPENNVPGGFMALVFAPPDLSVDPHDLCGVPPGAFYIVRIAGGLVPPSAGAAADSSVAASLEYALGIADIDTILILTHSECGLLRCLLDETAPRAGLMLEGEYLPRWSQQIAPAIARAARADISPEDRKRFCAQELIRVSIEHLMTYPRVLDGAYSGRIAIHGWQIDSASGAIARFDPMEDVFLED